jgi:hypothetical protein
MAYSTLKKILKRFRDDTRGVIMVETVIMLPLLVWALAATYEFFEIHRYQSIRDKATYTVADMISREGNSPGFITPVYLDNSLRLFNDIVNDAGVNQIRVSDVTFNGNTNSYEVFWSEVRGTGPMNKLANADVANVPDKLPNMANGEHIILVESTSAYRPSFNVGFRNNIPMAARTFTKYRFLPKLDYIP